MSDYDGVVVGERVGAVAFKERKVEDGEEFGVGVDSVAFKEYFGAVRDKKFIPPVDDAGSLCHFGDGMQGEDGESPGGFGPNLGIGSSTEVRVDPIDMIGLFVEAIEAELVFHPEQDQDADSEADSEAGDIEEAIEPVAADVAPS